MPADATRTAVIGRLAVIARAARADGDRPPGEGGGGTISAPTGVVFAPTIPADNTITGTWNPVANADSYVVARTDTPGSGGHVDLNSAGETTGTTFIDDDPALLDEELRGYVVYAVDADNNVISAASAESVTGLPQAGGADAIAPGTIIGWPGHRSFGIELPFTGDDTQQATATLELSTNGGADYTAARPLKRLQPTVTDQPLATTATTLTLTAGAGNVAGFYVGWRVRIASGTGAGQQRTATAYSGSPNRVLTVDAPWSVQPDTTSVIALQGPEKVFAGNVLWQTPGSTVRVRVTLDHPDGVNGVAVLERDITLKADDLTPAGELTITRYLSGSGDDANDGSSGAPWRTLDKAAEYINATGGNVALLGGRYTAREIPISGVGGLIAATPRVDDDRQRINAATRAIIEYGIVTGPLGGDAPESGVWQPQSYVGPSTGLTYDVYEYEVSTGVEAHYLGYADTYDAEPALIGKGKLSGSGLTTDAHKVEFMFENDAFNHHWFPATGNAKKIIARLPLTASSSNPNDLYLTVGVDHALTVTSHGTPVDGATLRISGVEFRGYKTSMSIEPTAQFVAIDHNLFCGMQYGITFRAEKAPNVAYGSDHLIERNLAVEHTLRAQPSMDPAGYISWPWIKGPTRFIHNGTTLSKPRVGEFNEGSFIRGQGGALRLTIRYNTLDGLFNGVNTYEVGYDRYAGAGQELYGNVFQNMADDCFGENEPNTFLFRAFENRAQYTCVLFTSAEGSWGPSTLARNVVWNWGYEEIAGRTSDPTDRGVDAILIKVSSKHQTVPTVEIINNTFVTNQPGSKFLHNANPGNPGEFPIYYLRNNIIACISNLVRSGESLATWDEDYTFWASPGGTRVEGNNTELLTLAEYIARAPGNGAHSNPLGEVAMPLSDPSWIYALLNDPENGDLTLHPTNGAAAVGAGVVVPNLTAFTAGTPDIGAGAITT